VQACADLEPVPGRMQQIVKPGQPLVAVDYAHTPMRWKKPCAPAACSAQRRASCGACLAAAATGTTASAR
jgi:UDP-N-acetylmuramoyl-L-alanyl-D-glutamate--2,6-diaminopimelate ligase